MNSMFKWKWQEEKIFVCSETSRKKKTKERLKEKGNVKCVEKREMLKGAKLLLSKKAGKVKKHESAFSVSLLSSPLFCHLNLLSDLLFFHVESWGQREKMGECSLYITHYSKLQKHRESTVWLLVCLFFGDTIFTVQFSICEKVICPSFLLFFFEETL